MVDEADPTSLSDITVRRTRREPATPFLLTIDEQEPDGVRMLTYGEVLSRATALARALGEADVSRGDRVGCYLSNSPSWVVA